MFRPHITRFAFLFLSVLTLGFAPPLEAQTTALAEIQDNPAAFVDSFVTVRGQVYIRTNYSPFSTSGYIQGASGRGINLFGSGATSSLLTDVGNIVELTGEVQQGTTVGMTNLTGITSISSGNPPATPVRLSTNLAASDSWEGTKLEINGTIQSSSSVSGGRNYIVDDGSGPVVVRVESVVSSSTIADGTDVTFRGAGTTVTGADILVGATADIVEETPPADTSPPAVIGAWSPQSVLEVRVTFSEEVDMTTAGATSNYLLFETATPANTITINSVAVSGPTATLNLPTTMTKGVDYTLRTSSVEDTSGNAMGTPQDFTFTTPVGDITPPEFLSASNTDLNTVELQFSESLDPTSGANTANYSVFETATPANTVAVSSANVAGSLVTLNLSSALAEGVTYSVQVMNIEDTSGNPISGMPTQNFTTSPPVTPIADIQNNTAAFDGQIVTVEGQVYVPSNYRAPTISGYIQDDSGRGINLFGSGADVPALRDISNIVRVTGSVTLFFTTVEIENITEVTLLSSGNPPRMPAQLTTGAAANSQWEGTFIEVTGPITEQAVGGPGVNYTVNDGSGPIVVRVVDTLGAPSFSNGTTITGRGAGGQFQTDFQVLVGRAQDVFEETGPDMTPPTLVSASGANDMQVNVNFSETVTAATANVSTNYELFETATPANTIAITSAALQSNGTTASLSLQSAMTDGTGYTVRVNNIQDEAGNTMAANSTVTFTFTMTSGTPIADIQANPSAFDGQVVTVSGQVYVPSNYRAPTISGYIQDGSGRGINLFGSGADVPALRDIGNIVEVTGTVTLFFTTVEIENITNVTLLSSGNPPLMPAQLSTGAAANSQWEGTFIEVTGPITTQAVGGPGVNYTVNDGSGPIVVRVVDTLGAPSFSNGTTITGRGAGGQFQSDFQVLVGQASDVFEGGSGPDVTPPTLTSANAPSANQVTANFSEAVTTATAGVVGNYTLFPQGSPGSPIGISSANVAGNRRSVTLNLSTQLTDGVTYTLQVSNIQDDAGNTIAANSSRSFLFSEGGVIPIATIQADPASFENQEVTVQAQVYIPSDYRGTTTSGYIQDDSGRGINVFGSGANVAALRDISNIVRVTGTVTLFFTTVEIENISEVLLISSGNPPLQPTVLTTAGANSSDWEGTFIQVTGQVTNSSASGPGVNISVNDGSGVIIVRVVDTLNVPAFSVGTTITARGAGGQFGSDFQINVGRSADIFEGIPDDTIPPAILRASLSAAREITVQFNENVDPTSGRDPTNYEVFRTNSPGTTVEVLTARFGETNAAIILELASEISLQDGYSVRVRNVADVNGNAISASGVTRPVEAQRAESVTLNGPPFTFLPKLGESYPVEFTAPTNILTNSGEIFVRVFDLHGRLRRTLFDSRFASDAFTDNRAQVSWDGRDNSADVVDAGTYIIHLLVVDRETGEREERQIPVVVATRLDR